jgi:hypothetical protein
MPVLKALALRVVVVVRVNGPVYWVELEVGSVPSVVYRMVAPLVVQEMLTVTDPI